MPRTNETRDERDREGNEVVTPTGLKMSKVITWLMYIWASIGVAALVLRVFLLATSANLQAGFAGFIIRTSNGYLQPFRGIFPAQDVSDSAYLDVSAIFAAVAYMFMVWGFEALVDYVQGKIDRNRQEQQNYLLRQSYEEQTDDMRDVQVSATGRLPNPAKTRKTRR